MTEGYHNPVMLRECIEALRIQPEGTYVDVTFGGGGHSKAILEKLQGGRLIAFDQDEDAKREAASITDRSFTFCQANFMYLKKYLKINGITKVDGILADLGISSHQIDSPERGFSTRFDGPLDMRMDQNLALTAAGVLNEYTEQDLHKIFGMYGELKNARTAAKMVTQQRANRPFVRTEDLKAALQSIAPRGKENKYFAQVFQALRIEVNTEMKALENFLHQCGEVMNTEGRLVVMSYHSLEDRMVKNYINKGKVFGDVEKDFYGHELKPFEAVNRKPIEASEEETEQNRRARSAKLRIAERLVDRK
ncbi:16S rRNA (cytosine(1402)-N(4))-methyltransferase RsmH [Parachryseolinea silvisoli]|jgi:16S rRNA (cytosine1402-N4)-methyltransferase|uniref:16S rRNA (cytosine(1402)-N(4))-methyltransferase RsmH n=1 Tax=Parachryseolinea silvisoli TaxID=2873601 RepID=UPI002265D22D|nr:16S rRNA (cytosine(1402)-N(4))-methyltransferase RsmH [Parachryseolinea silvisoli]MCD9018488.1 16S rRNA (cytosine(1402)-N(4))-methyltransferase RsmH [Parachryseolinea silvisoli]